MILVIMGMEVHPFDRLAKAVDAVAAEGTFDEDFFVQLGACTYVPKHVTSERYLPFGELCELIQESSAVVTHAGAGSSLNCIQQGKSPIMVPRNAAYGEHIDNHQVPFTEKMCEIGHATSVRDMSTLSVAIRKAQLQTARSSMFPGSSQLTDYLEDFWASLTPGARK